MFWTFKFSLNVNIFMLGDCFGYFLKNWVIFSNRLVALSAVETSRKVKGE